MRGMVSSLCVLVLAACASPPQPPAVDGSKRITINTADTISNLKGFIETEARPIETTFTPHPLSRSQTVTVYFSFNDSRFNPTAAQENILLPLLERVQRIEVRGRTDAAHPSASDEKIALMRAQSAKNYLIDHGVPAAKISINYVSGGDYVASNESKTGRTRNRRVEVEVFNQTEKYQ
jgi:outer membrane protein OmpA-like peptidoglycan-associated protein